MNMYNDLLNESLIDKVKDNKYYANFTVMISEALEEDKPINIEITLKSKDNKGSLIITFYSNNGYLYKREDFKDNVIKDSYVLDSITTVPNKNVFNDYIARYIKSDEFKLVIKKRITFNSYDELCKEPAYENLNSSNYKTYKFNPIAEAKII